MDLFQPRRGGWGRDLGDGHGFGGRELSADEGEAGSEVPRRRHPCSLACSAAVESETLGCGGGRRSGTRRGWCGGLEECEEKERAEAMP